MMSWPDELELDALNGLSAYAQKPQMLWTEGLNVHKKYMISHQSTAIWLSGPVPKTKPMHALMSGQMKLNMSSEGKPHI